jgi:hypothetical protein
VTSLAGVGIDESTGDIWVASSASGGDVWRLSGGPCAVTPVPALSGHAPLVLVGLLVAAGLASPRLHRRMVAGKRVSS